MESQTRAPYRILYFEAAGFLLLIVFTWLDEEVLFPNRQLISWFASKNWHYAVFESIVIFIFGITVVSLSYRIIRKLHYLESFIKICAWCRKVKLDDRWVSLEEYFDSVSDIKCSHGICKSCEDSLNKEAERLKSKMQLYSVALKVTGFPDERQ